MLEPLLTIKLFVSLYLMFVLPTTNFELPVHEYNQTHAGMLDVEHVAQTSLIHESLRVNPFIPTCDDTKFTSRRYNTTALPHI